MFVIAIKNVILTLLYIIPAFILCKVKWAKAEHLSTLSNILVYVCSPCMIINSFLNFRYDLHDLKNMGLFFVITLVLQTFFMLAIGFVFRRKFEDARYRVLTIGAVMGNVGFFGLPIIRALMPGNPEVLCYSSIYVFSMNLLVFTVGVFCLTGNKKFMSLKNLLLNPSSISIIIALPLYILGAGFTMRENGLDIFVDALGLLGSMTTPLCMFILGIRLAAVSFKKLFSRPLVYLTCALKLIVFPLFCYICVYFLPLEESFKASILILSSVPCASIILGMAEIHNGETELAANSVLVSTLMCFMTIPVLALLL